MARKKNTAAAAVREEISTAQAASELGLGVRRVQQLVEMGVFEKTGHGRISADKWVQRYVEHREEVLTERLRSETNGREQYEIERTRKLRLTNDETEGKLVATPAAIDALDFVVGQIAGELAALPSRITQDVAERRRIEDEINTIRAALAKRLAEAGRSLRSGGAAAEAEAEVDA